MHFRAMRSSCWAAVRVLDGRWPWMSRIDAVRGTFAPLHPVGTHQHPCRRRLRGDPSALRHLHRRVTLNVAGRIVGDRN
jgi:hypothetical protein